MNTASGPDWGSAVEFALRVLKLADRSDPITQIVAEKIIELAQRRVLDRDTLLRMALQEIRSSKET